MTEIETCKNMDSARRSSYSSSVPLKRTTNWSPEEDLCLQNLVVQHGPQKWGAIAADMMNRNGKQCRERWHNHLDPSIKKEAWSVEEEIILIKVCDPFYDLLL